MMRFRAPTHVATAWLSTGPVDVKNGTIETDTDLPQGDLRGLAAAGFVALPPLVLRAATTPASSQPVSSPQKD